MDPRTLEVSAQEAFFSLGKSKADLCVTVPQHFQCGLNQAISSGVALRCLCSSPSLHPSGTFKCLWLWFWHARICGREHLRTMEMCTDLHCQINILDFLAHCMMNCKLSVYPWSLWHLGHNALHQVSTCCKCSTCKVLLQVEKAPWPN